MKELATIIVAAATVVATTIGTAANIHLPNQDEIYENNCRQYEAQGVIKPGSCDCSEKLFDHWSHSYDWMDACAIVESKERGGK